MFQNWTNIEFCFESYFFLPGTDHSLKVHAKIEDNVRIKNLKSLLVFFKKFGRVASAEQQHAAIKLANKARLKKRGRIWLRGLRSFTSLLRSNTNRLKLAGHHDGSLQLFREQDRHQQLQNFQRLQLLPKCSWGSAVTYPFHISLEWGFTDFELYL